MMGQLADHSLELSAIVAGLVALGWLLKRAVSGLRTLRRWGRAWSERFAALEGLVHHELTPNSGSSAKDQLTRIESRLATVDGRSFVTAGLLSQHVDEGHAYVQLVRASLAAQGIELPDSTPPNTLPPTEEDPHA